jgi:hypothetical protein
MCDPITAMAGASFAIGAAQSVSGFMGKQQDAASMRAFQAQEAYNAEYARNQTYNQIGLRQQQEIDAASAALMDNQIRGAKAKATADTGAAEAGVQGNSVESVARGVYREMGRIDAATIKNTDMSVDQLQEEKKAADAQFRSRTNFSPVRDPSVIDLGLGIGAAGLGAYELYDRKNRIRGGAK